MGNEHLPLIRIRGCLVKQCLGDQIDHRFGSDLVFRAHILHAVRRRYRQQDKEENDRNNEKFPVHIFIVTRSLFLFNRCHRRPLSSLFEYEVSLPIAISDP